ncbi:cyanophycinase [Alicyclobacillus cycloheptanicus]|uniref:Cyanophycinase n=1 Tax=Alicyclobacillus cycloheptanicus TaxID=1457 RepID=A0ABT9XIQ8_9BACL|nr:cyanophycinase [Alicyclobacillus cycloheptanicus]MDQ0190168.1 cyanophycinase [Alicyclobacillus cycloheptanicus]WDM02578.1 cyanophycinase [Alicyclobacillus cycloheptanicus]
MQKQPGPLVIIGGAEDKQGECRILREFLRLGGGSHARVLVMTVATELPIEVGMEYIDVFKRLGAQDVRTFDVSNRDAANRSSAVEYIRDATCIFFTGGDQLRITKLLGGTRVDAALHDALANGVVLGGTSAGASMMSSTMIVEGDAETNPRICVVDMAPGMEFVDGVVIDQHFAQRGRLGRLLSAVAQYPHHLGLGIDENTAVIMEGRTFRVVGQGAVSVVDAGALTYTNIDSVHDDESLALCGVQLHILPDGFGFHLTSRQPITNWEEWNEKGGKELTK